MTGGAIDLVLFDLGGARTAGFVAARTRGVAEAEQALVDAGVLSR